MGTSIPGWSASDCRNSMAADLDEVLYPSTSVRVYVGTLMYNVRNSVDGHPGCFGNIHKARCHGQDLMIFSGGFSNVRGTTCEAGFAPLFISLL